MELQGKDCAVFPSLSNDGRFHAPISVEGLETTALLDTGAAQDLEVAEDEARARGWLDGLTPVPAPQGARPRFRVARPIRFRLGPFEHSVPHIWTHDRSAFASNPPFIVGMGFLTRHQVEFDYENRRAILSPFAREAPFPYERAQLLPFELYHGHPYLHVVLAGRPWMMIWDTGNAGAGLIFKDAVDEISEGLLAKLTWPRKANTVLGVRAVSHPIRFPRIRLCGHDYARDQAARSPAFEGIEFSALDSGKAARFREDYPPRSVAGLLPGRLFGARRVLMDPRRYYLWRLGDDAR